MIKIEKILIYGLNGKKRELSLNKNGLSIIVGRSKTGKSSVEQIIDYCLGSSVCDVSTGQVRNYSDWFALQMKLDDETTFFVARECPKGKAQSCSTVYYEISSHFATPDKVYWESNVDIENFVKMLTSRIGIDENICALRKGKKISASLRHSLFYCFQSQYEIANPKALFHRQSESFAEIDLKSTFRYFSGAVDADIFLWQAQMSVLEEKIESLERKRMEKINISGGKKRALQLIEEASRVGLIDNKNWNNSLNLDEIISIVDGILRKTTDEGDAESFSGADELTILQKKLNDLRTDLESIDLKIVDVQTMIDLQEQHRSLLLEGKNRLDSLNLFEKMKFTDGSCPFCLNRVERDVVPIEGMRISLEKLDKSLSDVEKNTLPLKSFLCELNEKKSLQESQIESCKEKIVLIKKRMIDYEQRKDLLSRQGIALGKLSLWRDCVEQDNFSDDELLSLRREYEQLKNKYDENIASECIDSCLAQISSDMTNWADELDLEYGKIPYRLSMKSATVYAETLENGSVPLKRMGSGANWVGVHLLAYFAIQKYFVLHNRPVPRFLLIDQPSQIYFPDGENNEKNVDWEKVKKIYKFIEKRCKELDGKLQVVVLDHAFFENESFSSAVIERWDGETTALIPYEWMDKV